MLNSSQRANAAKHRIRPAPPTQTQVNLLLDQLPIVFFVTLLFGHISRYDSQDFTHSTAEFRSKIIFGPIGKVKKQTEVS
jgi:hypothetical protein